MPPVRWADFDGDGRADQVLLSSGGAVSVCGNAEYVLGDNTTDAATVYAWQGEGGHGAFNDLGRRHRLTTRSLVRSRRRSVLLPALPQPCSKDQGPRTK
ncbi:hypothetical protein JIX56_44215 [Streptomyces sp. CA-210063]|uniref:hypothetical protein n=1 Tax=Streptomyces sp. CA-210063 TaxID=2801029 RepID=UPI00214B581D|nr:hypothetical protein [Streptomyces sp. CA-210063]UUU36272.1 hypothetical protein JIX56_44215 [Streptomyces sp. CA-210063]